MCKVAVLPHDGFANVGGNEQGDPRAKAVALRATAVVWKNAKSTAVKPFVEAHPACSEAHWSCENKTAKNMAAPTTSVAELMETSREDLGHKERRFNIFLEMNCGFWEIPSGSFFVLHKPVASHAGAPTELLWLRRRRAASDSWTLGMLKRYDSTSVLISSSGSATMIRWAQDAMINELMPIPSARLNTRSQNAFCQKRQMSCPCHLLPSSKKFIFLLNVFFTQFNTQIWKINLNSELPDGSPYIPLTT